MFWKMLSLTERKTGSQLSFAADILWGYPMLNIAQREICFEFAFSLSWKGRGTVSIDKVPMSLRRIPEAQKLQ